MAGSAPITFGTDGWRAVIGQDFTEDNVRRVADAVGSIWEAERPGATVYIGHDTREDADRFTRIAAATLAAYNLRVVITHRYLPTPALCWTVAQDPAAVGGLMLTASHNPAGYLGVKIRMEDGGASPVEFTDRVESLIAAAPSGRTGEFEVANLMGAYLVTLAAAVDADAIRAANSATPLHVVVDPLFGAGRLYLAQVLTLLGCEVTEIHGEADPSFGGLHPEPIPPWTNAARDAVLETGASAAFVTDGDADRIGAIDETGEFVSPHRIIALVAQHLVEDRAMSGRIVKTLSTSVTIDRLGKHLGSEVTTTPIGFKWIYNEMLAGDVLIGGEESGGIGLPGHVRERDGLLMALLLTEMMVHRNKSLRELVADLIAIVGDMPYRRVDLRLDEPTKDQFVASIPSANPAEVAGRAVREIVRADGLKFLFDNDEWLLMRPSGTEPLVRVYAEANSVDALETLLAAGSALVQGSPRAGGEMLG